MKLPVNPVIPWPIQCGTRFIKLMMGTSKDYLYDLYPKSKEELNMIMSEDRRNSRDDLDVRPEDSVSNIGIGSQSGGSPLVRRSANPKMI